MRYRLVPNVCVFFSTVFVVSRLRLAGRGLGFLALVGSVLSFTTTGAFAGNENWSAAFAFPGINGRVEHSIEDSAGNLYITGDFTSINGTRTNGIARWDGTSWFAMGQVVDGSYTDMALDSQGNLYVVYRPAESAVRTIVRWNGSTWSDFGAGVSDESSFSNIMIDSSDNLYAGGDFFTKDGNPFYAAKWVDGGWASLGTGLRSVPWSMVINSSGELLAVDGSALNYDMKIRKLAGDTWIDFEDSVTGRIYAMIVGPDGALYAGGHSFGSSTGSFYTGVARWSEDTVVCISDGQVGGCSDGWTQISEGISPTWGPYTGVRDLAFDQSGTLYVGGNLRSPFEPNQQHIVQWDGSDMLELAAGIAGDSVNSINILANGDVLAGGQFDLVDSAAQLDNIAVYDGSEWSGFAATAAQPTQGLDDRVDDMVSDGAGNVYVTGGFNQAGGVAANHIAHWDGQGWNALGAGLSYAADALALDDDGNLYVAGYEQQGVMVWNGASWAPMRSGLGEIYSLNDLVVSTDGDVYLGGYFSLSDDQPKAQIARWDGSSWVSYLDNIYTDSSIVSNEIRVSHMATGNDGLLYISGPIIDPNGGPPTGGIATWDGNQWEVIDVTPDFGSVGTIAVAPDGNLFVYASVTAADGSADSAIWQWDGNAWSLVVDTSNSEFVQVLAGSESGELFAGLQYGDDSVILRWDGTTWADIGTGIGNGRVDALAFARPDTLFVGGSFTTAGGKPSNNIASFTLPGVNVDTDGDGLFDYIEIALGLSPTKVDTDGNGVDDGDEDSDGDTATNLQEVQAGTDPGIDPETAGLDVPVLLNLVEITSQNASVEEGEDIIVTIERSGALDKPASVRYELSGTLGGDVFVQEELQDSASLLDFFVGRAVANVTATGTLVWAAGDADPKKLRISILTDEIPEGAETIELRLVDTSAGAATGNALVSFTIYDQPVVDIPGILLPHQEWRLISVPAMAGGQSTLRDVFADDIVLPYNTSANTPSWVVYEYLSEDEAPGYRALDLDDELKPGVGYWIIHAAGETVEIDLPSTTLASIVSQSGSCSSVNGCFERQLYSNQSGRRWQILGNPFYRDSSVGDMRIVSSAGGACADGTGGCTPTEAGIAGIIDDTLWHYDGEQYQSIGSSDSLAPWQGYWSAAGENAYAAQPRLLIPNQ